MTTSVTTASGASVTVVEFPAATTFFHLHVGSSDPPGAARLAPPDAGPAVVSNEASFIVAAFNGGFKQGANAGGMEVDGTIVEPLLGGKASMVIEADGSLHIGVWGQSVPTPGEPIVAVRQNLSLLVAGGHPTALAATPTAWGGVVGSSQKVARSAVGVDGSGNVFYAGSMAALPSDLAQAESQVGALSAMELDINPFWVTLGLASSPGAAMASGVPGQNHSPSIFTAGWERDFVTVLARPTANCRVIFPEPGNVAAPNPFWTICGSVSIHPRSQP